MPFDTGKTYVSVYTNIYVRTQAIYCLLVSALQTTVSILIVVYGYSMAFMTTPSIFIQLYFKP